MPPDARRRADTRSWFEGSEWPYRAQLRTKSFGNYTYW